MIGTADQIPYDDGVFDAAMAILTVHHWKDRARGPVVIMTFDPEAPTDFWMGDYAPELVEIERHRYGSIASVEHGLGGRCVIRSRWG